MDRALNPKFCRKDAYAYFVQQLPILDTTKGLLRAAAAIALHSLPNSQPAIVEERLEGIALRVLGRVKSKQVSARLAHLHDVLFAEEKFAGNTDEYYTADNSYLPRVLESKRGLPIVGMMAEHSYANLQIDRVLSDYRDATVTIMEHLIALHHRRIGFVYGIAVPTLGEDRLVAYQASLQAAGLPLDPALVIHCGPTVEDSYQATLTLLQRPHRPTALLAINDLLAAGALRAISDLGLKVPQDISLFGYDDISLAKYFVPRLSTASKDGEKTGQEAVRLLLARLQQPDLPRQEVRLPARVILRESIGPAPR